MRQPLQQISRTGPIPMGGVALHGCRDTQERLSETASMAGDRVRVGVFSVEATCPH
jgi:hypothetical protein